MDSEQFVQYTKNDPELRIFLNEVATKSSLALSREVSSRYVTVTGVDILAIIAAHALYRWLKEYFDHKRDLRETEIARQQVTIIKGLIKDGFPPESAQVVTMDLLKRIAERAVDKSAITSWAELITKN